RTHTERTHTERTHTERTHPEHTHKERTQTDLRQADRASVDHAPAGRSSLVGLPWLAIPPPPERSSDPPPWTGAAESLGDVAPIRRPAPSAYRADAAIGAADVRAAAAGRGTSRQYPTPGVSLDPARAPGARVSQRETTEYPAATRRRALGTVQVPVGISRRHLHLSPEQLRVLFGTEQLVVHRTIRQPGQFAAEHVVDTVGIKRRLEKLRVVGPARGETQLELARSDVHTLGIDAPVAGSGALDWSVGGVTLVGRRDASSCDAA
ncbi:MAG: PduL/EutD family phosphate acyltransferase, partial [Gemmatimonadota bacterium]